MSRPGRIRNPFDRSVEETVTVHRPPAEVWAFYSNFQNIPKIVGDVTAVEPLGDHRYRWIVELPLGRQTSMNIEMQESVAPELLRYRTTVGRMSMAQWRLTFEEAADGATLVTERLSGPLGPPFSTLLALIGKHPRQEVQANLARLKAALEQEDPERS